MSQVTAKIIYSERFRSLLTTAAARALRFALTGDTRRRRPDPPIPTRHPIGTFLVAMCKPLFEKHSRSQWCPLLQRLPSVTYASLLEGDCQMVPVGVFYMLNCRLLCIEVSTADDKGQVHAISLFLAHVSEGYRDFINQLHFTQTPFDRFSILPKALPTTA